MNWSFLHPLLWLGALAVAAPVWLHLRRKQEENRWDFSAVRFLHDEPQPRRSPLTLRDVWLLLLRLFAVLLVVAAFAWPFVRRPLHAPVSESRVYIFDNTLSRQAHGDFTRDLDRLRRELTDAGRAMQVAVVELTGQPRVLVSFGDDREAARQKLDTLEPSFQRGSYLAAFRQAKSLLDNSLGARRRIVLLGDNQENQWADDRSAVPFLQNVDVELPGARAIAGNLSLSQPRIERIFLGDKSVVNATAQLRRQGGAKEAIVTLRVNGQTIFRRSADLSDVAESILLQAQWEADPNVWLKGEFSVEGVSDELPADNRAFFVLAPVREGTAALLARSQFLRLALSPDIMRGRWATRVLEPSRLATEAGSVDVEVLCLEASYLQSSDARRLLQRQLDAGQGALLLVDRTSPLVFGALRELGFDPKGEATAATSFQYVFAAHPLFHPFVSSDFGNLGEVHVLRHQKLAATQALPLAFAENGEPLVWQAQRGRGKLFVVAFGFDRQQTSWPVHPTFIPFLDLCLQQARAEDATPTQFEPGELCVLPLPANSTVREVALRDDAGKELRRVPVAGGRATVATPPQPGIYALTFDGGTSPDRLIAVNPPAKESVLTYAAPADGLASWKLPAAQRVAAMGTSPVMNLTDARQQRWWWWLLVTGAVALAAETIWAAWKRPVS